jgi:hypothetical protein
MRTSEERRNWRWPVLNGMPPLACSDLARRLAAIPLNSCEH